MSDDMRADRKTAPRPDGDTQGAESGEGFDSRAAAVEALVAPAVDDAGYDLVRVQFMGRGGQTLQIMIERHDRVPITVDDCADVSRLLSAILDVEDPVPGQYTLEVSSPGLDRPLVRLEDFDRFDGFEARIEMHRPLDGRRRFQGRLRGTGDGAVKLECDGQTVTIPFADIRRSSLVVTDDLIEAASREAEAAGSRQ